jgi:hypothetical protein
VPGGESAARISRSMTAASTFASAPALKSPGPSVSAPPTARPIASSAIVKDEIEQRVEAVGAKSNGTATRTIGLTPEQVAEIKTMVQAQQKFLGELLEQSSQWELDGAELRIYFSPDKRPFAEMMEGREALEKIRAISSKVLGRTVRVCARLESVAAASASHEASSTHGLRAQFERDPMVRSMLQRFGGKISEVKRRQEES